MVWCECVCVVGGGGDLYVNCFVLSPSVVHIVLIHSSLVLLFVLTFSWGLFCDSSFVSGACLALLQTHTQRMLLLSPVGDWQQFRLSLQSAV